MGPVGQLHLGAGVLSKAGWVPGPERYRDITARALPFALYILILALGPVIRSMLPDGFDERWIYAVQVAIPAATLLYLWPNYTELREEGLSDPRDWVLGIGAGVLVFVLWIQLDFGPWVLGTADGFDPRNSAGDLEVELVVARLFGAVLVVPLMEELFWRSFIMRWLAMPTFMQVDPRSIGAMPLLVSSALFATEHHLWLAGLLAGLAYGWIYIRTANLWVPILAHAITNALLGAWVVATESWTLW